MVFIRIAFLLAVLLILFAVYEIIGLFRKKAKMTQAQLAMKIDKSFNYINSIECAAFFPPPDTIQKIAVVLDIRPMQLFDENANSMTIITDNKEQLISEISEKIYLRLQRDLRSNVAKVIDEIIN